MDVARFIVTTPEPRHFVDDHCANCLAPLPDDLVMLFCSSWCKDIAGRGRYWRRVIRDGRIEDPSVENQVKMDLAFLLIGGYESLGRKVPTATRAEVILRDDGKCQSCGKPGTDVDHIAGNSDDADNLQLLCTDCHRRKTNASLVPAPDEERALITAFYLTRIEPDEPRLLADDEQEWEGLWRSLQAARKRRFEESLTELGLPIPRKHVSKAQLIAKRDEHVRRVAEAESGGQPYPWVKTPPRGIWFWDPVSGGRP